MTRPSKPWLRVALLVALALELTATAGAAQARNVILFVADGLRSDIVTPQTAPALAEVRDQGVDLKNSHSIYPTFTTPNASVIATGHLLGDTGDFGNSLYSGKPLPPPASTSVPGLEDNRVLGQMNERFGGDFLGATTLLEAARAKGYSTAAIGKLGPTAIQDVTSRDGAGSIIIDDQTGRPGGLPLARDVAEAILAAGLPNLTPDRAANTWVEGLNNRGALVANVQQQDWFTAVATKVLLPRFKAAGQPFVLVFWSRDPDGTQHNHGDSLNTVSPGINGPTVMAAIRNASADLAALRATLKDLGLDQDTDIVVTADHGFSTISKESHTSPSARLSYPDVQPGALPPNFLIIDLAQALGLPPFSATGQPIDAAHGIHSKYGGLLGPDPGKPQVVVAANGGSDLIYLPGADPRAMARKIVSFLTTQDYTSAIFVRDDLGKIPGTLPMGEVGLVGAARTPTPAIVVGFSNTPGDCPDPEVCGVLVSDSNLQQGQGMHGSFGRQDTHNFMALIGPDFRTRFVDPAPVSNADIAVTLAEILDLDLSRAGLTGRVMDEALKDRGAPPLATRAVIRSDPAANGFRTILNRQDIPGAAYFDAAGAPGRTIGLEP
jgi:arylsulfatase A-like enzyme